jgi:hypothetical protein
MEILYPFCISDIVPLILLIVGPKICDYFTEGKYQKLVATYLIFSTLSSVTSLIDTFHNFEFWHNLRWSTFIGFSSVGAFYLTMFMLSKIVKRKILQ